MDMSKKNYLIQKTITTNSFHGHVQGQGACARKRRYYRIQTIINTNSFHGLVPRRYYLIQKFIVLMVLSQEDIISYRKLYILIVFMGMPKKKSSHSINDNSFYGLVTRRLRARKRRNYIIQKIINNNSFHVFVPRRNYIIQKL